MNIINAKILHDAPTDKYFWCKDGKVIRNLKEAAVMLRQMDNDTFRYHVNNERNDLANWVHDVFEDPRLAKKIEKKKSPKKIARIIEKRLKKAEHMLLDEYQGTGSRRINWFKKIFIPNEESEEAIRFIQPFIKGMIIGITISLVVIIILSILNFIK